MKQSLTLLVMLLVLVTALPTLAQSDLSQGFGFVGVRYDQAVAVSAGVLFDKVEIVPFVLDVDIGPLSSLWYTDIFSSAGTTEARQIGNVSFELVLKDEILTPRLTLGLLFGPNFDQQQTDGSITDYLAAAAGGLAAYNMAKTGARAWGLWGYGKYKIGSDNYIEGWHAGGGFFLRI